MIYLTAQPDRIKFYWQLRVQLENFRDMGISMQDVHVLVGNDIDRNSDQMRSLRDTGAKVFFYRYEKEYSYISSVRPNIIKQHFAAYPELTEEYIFYLDADVIFNRLPDFSKMPLDGTWYLSDTRNYISAMYIIGSSSYPTLKKLCQIVDVSPAVVQENEGSSGGCQYLLTGVDQYFWHKVEQDCRNLFMAYPNKWSIEKDRYVAGPGQDPTLEAEYLAMGDKLKLQIWCADMMAILWNVWRKGYRTVISPEMDFAWAFWDKKAADTKNIFHLSGIDHNTRENEYSPHFDKTVYNTSIPFGDDFSHINPNSATANYVSYIKKLSA
jgi:hypothetical protein